MPDLFPSPDRSRLNNMKRKHVKLIDVINDINSSTPKLNLIERPLQRIFL